MTDRLDLGAYRYEEGFFLVRDDAEPAEYVPGNLDTGRYRHVFSYRSSHTSIKDAVLDLIASARRKVFVASFRIGDTDLLGALYEAAERLRGGVYVVSALDEQSLRRGLQREDADAPGADDIRAQNKRFEDMTSRGITVRGHENFHAKFVVVDDRVALVSSANLETTALMDGKSRAVTGENGFLVSDVDEVDRLARYFTRLWQECTYQMPPGKDHTVQERSPSPVSCRVSMAGIDQSPSVIWTYTDELGIRDAIHDIIGRARRSLILATFSLNGIVDHPDLLLAPLERTVRRYGCWSAPATTTWRPGGAPQRLPTWVWTSEQIRLPTPRRQSRTTSTARCFPPTSMPNTVCCPAPRSACGSMVIPRWLRRQGTSDTPCPTRTSSSSRAPLS